MKNGCPIVENKLKTGFCNRADQCCILYSDFCYNLILFPFLVVTINSRIYGGKFDRMVLDKIKIEKADFIVYIYLKGLILFPLVYFITLLQIPFVWPIHIFIYLYKLV